MRGKQGICLQPAREIHDSFTGLGSWDLVYVNPGFIHGYEAASFLLHLLAHLHFCALLLIGIDCPPPIHIDTGWSFPWSLLPVRGFFPGNQALRLVNIACPKVCFHLQPCLSVSSHGQIGIFLALATPPIRGRPRSTLGLLRFQRLHISPHNSCCTCVLRGLPVVLCTSSRAR